MGLTQNMDFIGNNEPTRPVFSIPKGQVSPSPPPKGTTKVVISNTGSTRSSKSILQQEIPKSPGYTTGYPSNNSAKPIHGHKADMFATKDNWRNNGVSGSSTDLPMIEDGNHQRAHSNMSRPRNQEDAVNILSDMFKKRAATKKKY